MAKPKLRICTTMHYSSGDITKYIVMRGRMIGKAFDAAGAEIIGEYTIRDHRNVDYAAMTAPFATADAPAVYWQAEGWPHGR